MIDGVNTSHEKKGIMNITLTLMLTSTQQLQKILRTLRNVEGVTHVYRARS
jgi:GTP pyrophosphokinase